MRCKPMAYTVFASLVLAGCGDKTPTTPADAGTTGTTPKNGSTPATSSAGLKELKILDVKVGTGKAAAVGDTIWVHYTGTFADGKKFDSTKDHENKPFGVVLGEGSVVPGWEKGLLGMKVGGERKLSIPWKLGYGENGSSSIPPKTDLYFDIEAVGLVKQNEQDLVQGKDIKVGTGAAAKNGSKVTIRYTMSIPGGEVVEDKKTVTITIGKGEAMDSLEQAIIGMKVGGKRNLIIPPRVGLPNGNQKVPQNCPVIFDVDLLKVG
ncbi:FKBP-type peptidyl-prolyl cis-trans isomerase [Fimbriimonas ginsengisoli]|uniref:Peptidyl-prolyl cis-trans isomerase n=1 Tax=Fimbriimonas ginsengisoli Gsoil 348 TaxID=661478 RepID=A0A068NV25_FIMGI|nr:FKBP-type peptidyl-prolyl cis-trans isomerase [Fimbriimonas ginsengisoli]AIE87393.1 Peptidyl-prolyl cis-trans isomerase [Fimbriimonas ginsengisoli Gsoil 348]